MRNRALILFFAALTVIACRENRQNPPRQLPLLLGLPAETEETIATGTIGAGGGRIIAADGSVLSIPAGALENDIAFVITRKQRAGIDDYAIAPALEFKHEILFSLPVRGLKPRMPVIARVRQSERNLTNESPPQAAEHIGDRINVRLTQTGHITINVGIQSISTFYVTDLSPGGVPQTVRICAESGGNVSLLFYRSGFLPVAFPAVESASACPGGNWYSVPVPFEALENGLRMQAFFEKNGAIEYHPSAPALYRPAGWNEDVDGDGLLDIWEMRNTGSLGYAMTDGIADRDGDRIPAGDEVWGLPSACAVPKICDTTPNGENNPAYDTLELHPQISEIAVGDSVAFFVRARYNTVSRFVFATIYESWSADAYHGTFTDNVYTATLSGIAPLQLDTGSGSVGETLLTIRDTLTPADITDLIATTIDHNRIRLDWTATGDDGNTGRANNYRIAYSSSPIIDDVACLAAEPVAAPVPAPAGTQESGIVTDLTPLTAYYFCILARDDFGNSSGWSGNVSATTGAAPDTVPPGELTVSALAIDFESIRLSWIATGDDGGTGTATNYRIRRSLSPITDSAECDAAQLVPAVFSPVPAAGTSMSFAVDGLSFGLTYYFCVRAIDDSGNRSPWNAVVSAATPFANLAPVVSIADRTFDIRQAVAIAPDVIYDPDDGACQADPAQYRHAWKFLARPLNSYLTDSDLGGRYSTTVTFVPDVPGNYDLQFAFIDDAGICGGGNRPTVKGVTVTITDRDPVVLLDVNPATVGPAQAARLSAASDLPGNYELRKDGCSGNPLASGSITATATLDLTYDLLDYGDNTMAFCVIKSPGKIGVDYATVTMDDLPPIVQILPAGTNHGTAPEISFQCTDITPCEIRYTLDGNDPASGTVYVAPFPLPDFSVTNIRYLARDAAGNTSNSYTATYRVDSSLPAIQIAYNQYAAEHGNGQSTGYDLTWSTDRIGTPYRIVSGNCASPLAILESGTTATGPHTSNLSRAFLASGARHTIRICVENLAGIYGESTFALLACDSGQHAEANACAPNGRTEAIAGGHRDYTWSPATGLWSQVYLGCNEGFYKEGNACVIDCTAFSDPTGTGLRCKSLPEKIYAIDFGCPENPDASECYVGRWLDMGAQFSATPALPGVTGPFTWRWLTAPGPTVALDPDGWMHGIALAVPGCYPRHRIRVESPQGHFREKVLTLCIGW